VRHGRAARFAAAAMVECGRSALRRQPGAARGQRAHQARKTARACVSAQCRGAAGRLIATVKTSLPSIAPVSTAPVSIDSPRSRPQFGAGLIEGAAADAQPVLRFAVDHPQLGLGFVAQVAQVAVGVLGRSAQCAAALAGLDRCAVKALVSRQNRPLWDAAEGLAAQSFRSFANANADLRRRTLSMSACWPPLKHGRRSFAPLRKPRLFRQF